MIGKMSSPLIAMVCFLCIVVVFIAYDEFYIKDDDKVLFWIVFAIIICFLLFLLLCLKYVEANDDDYRKLAIVKKEFPELEKDFEKAMQDNVITLEEANEIFKKEKQILEDKVIENTKKIKNELKGETNGN
jgi:hypothetical protein